MLRELHEIDAARVAAGLTWAAVCSKAGISYQTVWRNISADPDGMKIRSLKALSAALDALTEAPAKKDKTHGKTSGK